MVNTRKNSCPIGYKNMDQVISLSPRDGVVERAPGPGLKFQATSFKPQASSDKQQATDPQASSGKHQAPSYKHQASSRKQQAAQ